MSTPTIKTVELSELVGAEITQVSVGLPTDSRCDGCGAQAYVEVEMYNKETKKTSDLLFCAHHYRNSENGLRDKASRIIDHRPFLLIEEAKFKGALDSE